MKNYFLSVIFACIVVLPSYARTVANPPELVVSLLNYCYETENQFGVDLAQCLLKKLQSFSNPDEYRVSLLDDQPKYGKTKARPFAMTIYNKFGDVLTCEGTAKEKIVFTTCISKKIPKITPSQQMSIDPKFPSE